MPCYQARAASKKAGCANDAQTREGQNPRSPDTVEEVTGSAPAWVTKNPVIDDSIVAPRRRGKTPAKG